ncbi:hypothetical protein CLAIMM_07357 [Cladophialophora immunda]|nr:hypothetical protein CLAIMM_07357 [Cladophialophora immunda]
MQRLFVASYDGVLRTIEFSEEQTTGNLKVVAECKDCAPNPSWITLDTKKKVLFCNSNDGANLKGSLNSYSIRKDGSLERLDSLAAHVGAAYQTFYNDRNALAIPYYYSGLVGTYNIQDPGHLHEVQILKFPSFIAGSGRSQDQPRPHQTVVDPTGNYLLVPDLGADRIRVFSIAKDPSSLHQISEIGGLDLERKPSFPRHVIFAVICGKTMLYILNQDICTILTYRVEYLPEGGLSFQQEGDEIDLMQRGTRLLKFPELPPGEHATSASQLDISSDNRFLICSVRKDRAFEIKSPFDPEHTVVADSILSYHIDQDSGALTLANEAHAGGYIPRHFSLNKEGDRIAITQQANGWVSIYDRNVETGQLGKLLAIQDGFGEQGPICVKWYYPE